MSLQLGSEGADVRELQGLLERLGQDIQPNGIFGAATDRAVRAAKRRIGFFPPDGIVGERAIRAFDAASSMRTTAEFSNDFSSAVMAQQVADTQGGHTPEYEDAGRVHLAAASQASSWKPTFPWIFPQNPATMRASQSGLSFIEAREEQAVVSEHLHFPGNNSGVTLGPGYDMGGRSRQTIIDDLTAIGVSQRLATAAAEGSGKTGQAAKTFVDANSGLLTLTARQQAQLLTHTVGHYEDIVHRNLTRWLYQYEFDALVSFAYNSGGAFGHVATAINAGRTQEAMGTIQSVIHSKKRVKGTNTFVEEVMNGLVDRRKREVDLYLYGKYNE